MGGLPGVVALLIALKCAASFLLSKLNRSEVSKYKSNAPAAVLAVMDKETYEKSVAYTLVKSRFESNRYCRCSCSLYRTF